jgi:hypothetical protein
MRDDYDPRRWLFFSFLLFAFYFPFRIPARGELASLAKKPFHIFPFSPIYNSFYAGAFIRESIW